MICRAHLEAALEVWRYCAQSAAYIFGRRTGDPVADEILAELRKRAQFHRCATPYADHGSNGQRAGKEVGHRHTPGQ